MAQIAHLLEETLVSEVVFQGKLLRICRDQVTLSSGARSMREYVLHGGGVLVVPVLDNGRLVFERQYRHPVGQVFVEFPAGKIDPGEDLLAAAQRELLEETGYRAASWQYLADIHPCIGYSSECLAVYLARDLQAGVAQPDENELIDYFDWSLDEALQAVARAEITDAKTLAALFLAQPYLS